MRAIIEDENAEDGVQLRVSIYYLKKNPILKNFYTHDFILLCLQSYCQNHSLNKKAGNVHLFSEMVLDDSDDDEIEEVVEDEDEN